MKYLFILMLFGCATNQPDFKATQKSKTASRIYVYWPRQWQSQWAEFQIYSNNALVKVLLNEGYIEIINPPAKTELKSHHFQDKKFIVTISLDVKPGKDYFFKLDTQPKEVTIMSAFDDISSVGTIVSGMKSEMRLKEGHGSWRDAKNYIDKEKLQLELEANRKATGYHVLLPIDEDVALKELVACCTSKNVK